MFPILSGNVASATAVSGNSEGIFAFGYNSTSLVYFAVSNLVSDVGVVGSDVAAVGTARRQAGACEYGEDKGIMAYGNKGAIVSMSNLVSNAGVVSSDVAGVGTARNISSGAASYGTDKGIFAYGYASGYLSMSNLVTNVGVIGSDVSGVGTARDGTGACEYGDDKAIFAYGYTANSPDPYVSMSNLVSNVGVIGDDVTGVGTTRSATSACRYGGDKGIFAYGAVYNSGSWGNTAVSNLVSNVGVIGTDVAAVGATRHNQSATQYGKDKGIFAFGDISAAITLPSNLVSNTGVVASDVTAVGSKRGYPGACSFN